MILRCVHVLSYKHEVNVTGVCTVMLFLSGPQGRVLRCKKNSKEVICGIFPHQQADHDSHLHMHTIMRVCVCVCVCVCVLMVVFL